jgi:hypothetical protein
MSKMPPIPPEQRSFSQEQPRDRLRSAQPGRRDDLADKAADTGSQGDISINTHHQAYQQDR